MATAGTAQQIAHRQAGAPSGDTKSRHLLAERPHLVPSPPAGREPTSRGEPRRGRRSFSLRSACPNECFHARGALPLLLHKFKNSFRRFVVGSAGDKEKAPALKLALNCDLILGLTNRDDGGDDGASGDARQSSAVASKSLRRHSDGGKAYRSRSRGKRAGSNTPGVRHKPVPVGGSSGAR